MYLSGPRSIAWFGMPFRQIRLITTTRHRRSSLADGRGGRLDLTSQNLHFYEVLSVQRQAWFQSTNPEILKLKIGMFSVTSFTSITGLLERAA